MEKLPEAMHPDDFVQFITTAIDQYFYDQGYDQMWLKSGQEEDPETVAKAIKHRIHIGFYNEIFIRDAAMMSLQSAPSLKAQQALLKQVEDEHKHAFWLLDACQKKGFDPRESDPGALVWPVFWEYIYGRSRDKENFFSVLSTTQLVAERLFGLKATEGFARQIADIDPEISELYGKKIYRDEVFHTIQLPESILREHCTRVEDQNRVIDGFERAKLFLKLMFQTTEEQLKTA